MKKRLFFFLLIAVMWAAALGQCQQLVIQTEPGKQTVLTRADFEALPHRKVSTSASDSPITLRVLGSGLCWKRLELGWGNLYGASDWLRVYS